ncbi:glycosyl transferase, partial [Rubrivivax gelatinosus]|nr:glycosyl transferase [Rubrivivax gelatinosus]
MPLLSGTRRAWSQARRVLALRLDNLGDLLMTTPALAAIRESLAPDARLTLLTSPAGAAAAVHLPFVDEVLTFDAPWVGGGAQKTTIGLAETALLLRLADGAYDAAVIFTVCTQSALPAALLCRMAGIPLVLAHNRENPYALLSDWIPEPDHVADTMRHEVRRQLDLVAAVGWRTADERLRFELRPADRARVAARLAGAGVAPGRRYALLHPGASAASRRWPAERFA